MVVTLSKEYTFEGKKYTELDMSCLNNLTELDLETAQRAMQNANMVSPVAEMNIVYAMSLASTALQVPIEFFKGLPAKDAIAVRNAVTTTFLG